MQRGHETGEGKVIGGLRDPGGLLAGAEEKAGRVVKPLEHEPSAKNFGSLAVGGAVEDGVHGKVRFLVGDRLQDPRLVPKEEQIAKEGTRRRTETPLPIRRPDVAGVSDRLLGAVIQLWLIRDSRRFC